MNAKKMLFSVGAAIASTKLAHLITDLGVDDVLRPVGLSRRRSHVPENLAFLGIGVLVGGAAALLLAPSSGEETRRTLARKAEELGDAAQRKVREYGEELNGIRPRLSNREGTSAQEPT